jgi:hypothetical protein
MIEDLIKKNLDLFYEDDLPEDHLNRFIRKLDVSDKHKIRLKTIRLLAIAASVALLITSAYVITTRIGAKEKSGHLLARVSPELRETEFFYCSQIKEKTKILSALNKIDPATLSSDLKEMDADFKAIHDDFTKNPGDDRIVSAVISSYQAKLEFLDNLIDQTN